MAGHKHLAFKSVEDFMTRRSTRRNWGDELEAALEHYTGPRLHKGEIIAPIFIGSESFLVHPSIITFKPADRYECTREFGVPPDEYHRAATWARWFAKKGHEMDAKATIPGLQTMLLRLLPSGEAVVGVEELGKYRHPGNQRDSGDPKNRPSTYWKTGNNIGWVYSLNQTDIERNVCQFDFKISEIKPIGARREPVYVEISQVLEQGNKVICVDHCGDGIFVYQLLEESQKTFGKEGPKFLYPVQGIQFKSYELTDQSPIAPMPVIAIIDPKKV